MRNQSLMVLGRLSAVLFMSALSLLAGSTASARTEVLSWAHQEPCSIDSFELRWGTAPNALNNTENVGKPRQAGGHFSYALEIADQDALYACVAAVRGSETSPCSNQLSFAAGPIGSPRSEPAPAEQFRSWCDDFSAASLRSGWVSTGPNSSLDPSPQLFGLAELGGNRALTTSSTGSDIHSHFLAQDERGVQSSQWSRYEYSGQMEFSDAATGIGVTLYSRFDSDTGYYRLERRAGSGFFRLEREQVDPTFNCQPGTTAALPVVPNTRYQFRILAKQLDGNDATELKMKVWPANRREPDGFQQRCTDVRSSRQLAGSVGVWSSGPGQKVWDSLFVAELGDPSAGDLGPPGKPELAR